MLSTLADYAAIAIENARLYARSEWERGKLESILTGIEEGVIVVDNDRRVVLINRKACEAFDVQEQNLTGKRARDVFNHQELLEVLRDTDRRRHRGWSLAWWTAACSTRKSRPFPALGWLSPCKISRT